MYHPNLLNDCGVENQREVYFRFRKIFSFKDFCFKFMRILERQNFDASERYTEVKVKQNPRKRKNIFFKFLLLVRFAC